MRARRSLRTRETTCIASSCQCQTSPGTDGTGALGHARPWAGSWTMSPAIASPSCPLAGGTGSAPGRVHPDRSRPRHAKGGGSGREEQAQWRRGGTAQATQSGRAGRPHPDRRAHRRHADRGTGHPRRRVHLDHPASATTRPSRSPTSARWHWPPTSSSTSTATGPASTPAAAACSFASTTCAPRCGGPTTWRTWQDDGRAQLAVGAAALPGQPPSAP